MPWRRNRFGKNLREKDSTKDLFRDCLLLCLGLRMVRMEVFTSFTGSDLLRVGLWGSRCFWFIIQGFLLKLFQFWKEPPEEKLVNAKAALFISRIHSELASFNLTKAISTFDGWRSFKCRYVGFKTVLEARLGTISAVRQQRAGAIITAGLPWIACVRNNPQLNSIPLFDCCDP